MYFCLNIVGPYVVVLCCHQKRFSLSKSFPFFAMSRSSRVRFRLSVSCFSSHFCFLVIIVPLIFIFPVPFLFAAICLSLVFFYVVLVFMHRGYLQFWWVFFHLLSLTHTACLCHLWYVRHYILSSAFLFSAPFVEVLPSFISRMAPSILQKGQPRGLSL